MIGCKNPFCSENRRFAGNTPQKPWAFAPRFGRVLRKSATSRSRGSDRHCRPPSRNSAPGPAGRRRARGSPRRRASTGSGARAHPPRPPRGVTQQIDRRAHQIGALRREPRLLLTGPKGRLLPGLVGVGLAGLLGLLCPHLIDRRRVALLGGLGVKVVTLGGGVLQLLGDADSLLGRAHGGRQKRRTARDHGYGIAHRDTS